MPLRPTASRVLAVLVSRRGDLVTRSELREAGWPGAPAGADQSLNTAIKQIRAALSDDVRTPRFIATVHRRGYRMIPPVEEVLVGPAGWHATRSRRALSGGVRKLTGAAALGAAFLAGQRFAGPPTPSTSSEGASVSFHIVESSASLVGIDERLADAVHRHLALPGPESRKDSTDQGVLVTGVISPAPDGADLLARIIRRSDGATLWTGSFNPYCADAPGDPVEIIGRYLARTVAQIHRT